MKHHLTFKDESSDKFWNIEVDGNSFTVTYGKTGTNGFDRGKKIFSLTACPKTRTDSYVKFSRSIKRKIIYNSIRFQ
ncbi:WGR domain-containing protein [Leptospira santarosai]|nr:WGR domain-containing protein [Leptospira santarosai]MDI7207190.1 WGR domain-containing protein [Leptospira santarosai]